MPNTVHGCRVDVAARQAAAAPHGVIAVAEHARETVLHAGALGALVRPRCGLPPRGRGRLPALETCSPRPRLAAVAAILPSRRRRRTAQDKLGVLVQVRRRGDAPREVVAAARVSAETGALAVSAAVGDGWRAERLRAEAAREAGAGVGAQGEAVLRVPEVTLERPWASVAGFVEDDGASVGIRAAIGRRAGLHVQLAHPARRRRGFVAVDAIKACAVLGVGGVAMAVY